MPDPDEYTESGQPVYRYGERKIPFQFTGGDEQIIEAVEKHIAEHIAEPESVFHEIISDLVHIDVHFVRATEDRPYHVLVTSGMSSAPMNGQGPDGPFQTYAELCILLPPDWKLQQKDFKDERNYFPIRWLKFLARFPHEYDTWLGWGHTMPNGDPPEPVAPGVGFTGWVLLPPVVLSPDFFTMKIDEHREVNFYAILPLYQDEMDFKLKQGSEALTDLFDKHGVNELLNISRPSVIGGGTGGDTGGDAGGGRPWWRRLFG